MRGGVGSVMVWSNWTKSDTIAEPSKAPFMDKGSWNSSMPRMLAPVVVPYAEAPCLNKRPSDSVSLWSKDREPPRSVPITSKIEPAMPEMSPPSMIRSEHRKEPLSQSNLDHDRGSGLSADIG